MRPKKPIEAIHITRTSLEPREQFSAMLLTRRQLSVFAWTKAVIDRTCARTRADSAPCLRHEDLRISVACISIVAIASLHLDR
jgi:hypothetical protein